MAAVFPCRRGWKWTVACGQSSSRWLVESLLPSVVHTMCSLSAGVVQPETVAHLLVHHLFFVKGCDEECHVRQSLSGGAVAGQVSQRVPSV